MDMKKNFKITIKYMEANENFYADTFSKAKDIISDNMFCCEVYEIVLYVHPDGDNRKWVVLNSFKCKFGE